MNNKDKQKLMKVGCVNHKIRILFFNPRNGDFVGLSPDYLIEHGPPYDAQSDQELVYNSTHIFND